MASKAHVQDNSVVERRLRPIYEWLDSGNNKKALQECDKVLKKTPNLLCAKALKALSLLRIGKETDCVSILDALTSEKPADDATLQAMTLCYRELQQLDKICHLYEAAIKVDASNEELHTHLFMSHVRMSDFKSQQQVAMNLYKLIPKNPYYCWAVMSVILQATRGQGTQDAQKRTLLLSLAERMIDKLVSDNKLEAEQEVQLYLMILELQNKYEEALNVVNGQLGEKLVCATQTTYNLPYLLKLKRWSDVNLICKGVLLESVDRWDVWIEYVKSVFELMSLGTQLNNHTENHSSGDNDAETVDDTPEKAHEFICRLVENGADNGYLLRGPYLARFELCSKLLQRNMDTNDLLGETVELFIEYFRKFGHKSCCVSDLRIYLHLLDAEKQAELSGRLLKDVGISATNVPQTDQQMQRHLCSLQLSRLCGSHRNLSADHLGALVTALSLHYQHGYQTYGTNLLSTDQGPSDAYALIAAHVLYDLAQLIQNSKPIITALVLLEHLLNNSPSNFHAKLLCIRLYHTLGGASGAHAMYESLDVKHLQLDSLGYIHCARLPTTGLLTVATNLYDTTLKFFASNYKDSSDHLTFSYKFGSFIKLDEFMDFREKLNNSLHYAIIAVDRIILSLMQCTTTEGLYNLDTSPKDNKIDWEELRDNYDLSVYICWDSEKISEPLEENDQVKRLFEQDVHFLKLRANILWALSASVDIAKSTDGTRNKHIDSLKVILKDWEDACCEIQAAAKYVPIKQNIVALPLPSRLHCHVQSPYLEILEPLFRLTISIAAGNIENSLKILQQVQFCMNQMVDNVSLAIEKQNDAKDCLWERRTTMELVVNAVEITCISTLLCMLCSELIKPPQGKKSKKKFESPLKDVVGEVMNIMKQQINNLDSCLESWRWTSITCDISERLIALNLNTDGQDNVLDHIKYSHITAVKELRAVLKNKIKFISCLSS